ncbi:MAG: hypothetical protein ACREX9_10995, partial [Gammaproteobacteria bacterium]
MVVAPTAFSPLNCPHSPELPPNATRVRRAWKPERRAEAVRRRLHAIVRLGTPHGTVGTADGVPRDLTRPPPIPLRPLVVL